MQSSSYGVLRLLEVLVVSGPRRADASTLALSLYRRHANRRRGPGRQVGEARMARLHRRVHRYPVALGVEQVAGQMDARGPEERPVERMPLRHPLQIGSQQVVWRAVAEGFQRLRAVEAEARLGHDAVDVLI